MGLMNKYKNKLMSNTNSFQNTSTDRISRPTSLSINGLGGSSNLDNDTYRPDVDPKTTLNNNSADTTETTDTVSNPTSNGYTWKDYADMISAKTANSKMELQSAMQRAQSASNEYLRAMGLQGSGLGQSQLTDIGAQYQNAMANINQQAEYDVNSQLDTDFKDMVDSGKASTQEIEDYINKYGEQTGLTNSWNNYIKQVGADYDSSISSVIEDLNEMKNGDTYTTVNGVEAKLSKEQKQYASYVQNLLDNAISSGDRTQIDEILEKYNNFLNNPSSVSLSDQDIYEMDMYQLNNMSEEEIKNKTTVITSPGMYGSKGKKVAEFVKINGRKYQYNKKTGEWERLK